MRRVLDIVLSLLLLVLSLPVLIGTAIAIRLHDGGPAIFRQTRVGRDLKPFTILKFRSMRIDRSGAGTGEATGDDDRHAARARFRTTRPDDERITPVGRLIRRAHLDELPQLLNVLRGDMSLVGVRPDTPAQEVDYDPEYWKRRHRLRPGITGLAQTRAGNTGTPEQRRHWEERWIEDPSPRRYVTILLETVGRVLRRGSF